MSERIWVLVACVGLACPIRPALAQPAEGKKGEPYPAPPADFDKKRDGVARGKLETVEYDSTTVGMKRAAVRLSALMLTTEPRERVLATNLAS
jgi:hypothetical protein